MIVVSTCNGSNAVEVTKINQSTLNLDQSVKFQTRRIFALIFCAVTRSGSAEKLNLALADAGAGPRWSVLVSVPGQGQRSESLWSQAVLRDFVLNQKKLSRFIVAQSRIDEKLIVDGHKMADQDVRACVVVPATL